MGGCSDENRVASRVPTSESSLPTLTLKLVAETSIHLTTVLGQEGMSPASEAAAARYRPVVSADRSRRGQVEM